MSPDGFAAPWRTRLFLHQIKALENEDTMSDLSDLTKPELAKRAEEAGMAVKSDWTKAELVEAIEAVDGLADVILSVEDEPSEPEHLSPAIPKEESDEVSSEFETIRHPRSGTEGHTRNFIVKPGGEKYAALATNVVTGCCDESDAIRIYCERHKMKASKATFVVRPYES